MRTNDGFEDREGHQAPFTLREEDSENAERRTSNVQFRNAAEEQDARLFNFLNRGNDLVEIGPVAGFEFGMDELVIGADFEGATTRGDEGERRDAIAEFKNFGRQTDGLRRVVSDDAVFDRHFGLHLELSFPHSSYRCGE